jgi:HAMP domain-containing protein
MMVVGTVLLAIVILVTLAIFLTRIVIQQEGNQPLTAISQATSDLIAAPLVAHNTDGIKQILAAVVREEGLDRAFVFTPDGAVVAAQLSEQADGEELSADDQDFALGALRAGQLSVRDDGDNTVDLAAPIVANGQTVGLMLGQSSTEGAVDELLEVALPQMSAAGLGVALLAGLLALAMARYIAAPLHQLSAVAMAVGQGELESLPDLRGSAEVSALAGAFGKMVEDLRTSRAAVAEQHAPLRRGCASGHLQSCTSRSTCVSS